MKSLPLLFLTLFGVFSSYVYSQSKPAIGDTFKLKQEVIIYPYDIGTAKIKTGYQAKKFTVLETKFRFIAENAALDGYILEIAWNNASSSEIKNLGMNVGPYFLVKRSEFAQSFKSTKGENEVSVQKKTELTLGALLLPVKMRFADKSIGQPVNLATEISIDASLGIVTRSRILGPSNSFIPVVAIGGSVIDLDESTVASGTMPESKKAGGVSLCLGFVLQFNKVQIGTFTGFDFLLGNKVKWAYQSKPWITLGFGYNIYTIKSAK